MKNPVDRFDIERIFRLYEAQDYSNCLNLVKKVSERKGEMTGYLHWISGICEDMTGNPFEGLLHFKSAIAADPCNYNFLASLSANMNIFRSYLMQYLDGDGTLQDIQKIHRFLVEAGEFSSAFQYLVARNYIKREQYINAREILAIYLINNPNDEEALALEKIIEKEIGSSLAS